MVRLCYVRYSYVRFQFDYISCLYSTTQELGMCHIYKRALTGTAAGTAVLIYIDIVRTVVMRIYQHLISFNLTNLYQPNLNLY